MNKLQENHKEKLSQAHCKCKQTYENSYLPNFSWTNPTRNTVQPTSLYPSRSSEQDVTSFAAGTDNSQSTLCPSCALKKSWKIVESGTGRGAAAQGATFRLPFCAVVVAVDVAVFHWDAIKYIAVKVSTLAFPLTSEN